MSDETERRWDPVHGWTTHWWSCSESEGCECELELPGVGTEHDRPPPPRPGQKPQP